MSYERQLDLVVTALVTVVVFVGCVFYCTLLFSVSLAIAGAVFVAGLVLGRDVAHVLHLFFG